MLRTNRKPSIIKYICIAFVVFILAVVTSIITRMLLVSDVQLTGFSDDQAGLVTSMIEGAVGAVAAGFVLYQLKVEENIERRENEIHEAEYYQHFVNYWLETDKLFLQHPQCRKYFYDNADIASLDQNSRDYELILCFAEYFDDLFVYSETEVLKIHNSSLPKEQVNSYLRYMARIKNSPGFIAYKQRYSEWINTCDKGV